MVSVEEMHYVFTLGLVGEMVHRWNAERPSRAFPYTFYLRI